MQRWRVASGAVLQKWPTEVGKYGGWFLYILFLLILMWEELWKLEDTAYLSSFLLLLITSGAMIGSYFFERRIWCRHLCPIGGMNGLYAKLALTELRAQNGRVLGDQHVFYFMSFKRETYMVNSKINVQELIHLLSRNQSQDVLK